MAHVTASILGVWSLGGGGRCRRVPLLQGLAFPRYSPTGRFTPRKPGFTANLSLNLRQNLNKKRLKSV